jgi:subfamily B ATP-binding cassette protein MsbA
MTEPPLPGSRRDAYRDMTRLLAIIGKPVWTTPVLIGLGFASSLAETLGITLVLLFIYAATRHVGGPGNGMVAIIVTRASHWFGGTTALAFMVLLMIIARGALAMLYGHISGDIAERISERARNLVHRQYLSVAFGFLQRHEQALLMDILGTETWLIASVYHFYTRLIINACSISVFSLFLLAISWRIVAVAGIGATIISLIARRFTGPSQALSRQAKQIHQALGEQMLLTVQGMRTIRAYGQEATYQQRFEAISARARRLSAAARQLSAWLSPVTDVGYLATVCIIVGGAGWWHTSFTITLGAVALLYRLQPHTSEFEYNLLSLAQSQPRLRSVVRMLETGDKPYPPEGHIPISALRQDITFDKVTFRYHPDSAAVLDGVSFTIPAGVTTALIGPSGSGKTTIVNLVLRLYQPDAGRIIVDGHGLEDLRRTDWVSLLAAAGQDVDLVEGNVIDNIRMANPAAREPDILAAAKNAGVAEFVENLPGGYDTWIGQEGMRFSGGQRQRIGLARAFLRDPQFLILDEAMSALDRGLEDRIRRTIETRLCDRTILIITHRLETIRNVDHVIWIENGRIKAEGPPKEIMPSVLAPSP